MLEYDRVRLKTAARQAMRGQRPHPMLVTLLFSVIVGAGSQIINWILGAATGSASLSRLYAQAFLEYQDVEAAIQYALMSFGLPRLIFTVVLGGLLTGLLVSLWQGIMRVGYSGFCLSMARGRQPQYGELFLGFPRAGTVLAAQLLVTVFCFLWGLLLGAGGVVLMIGVFLLMEAVPALAVLLMLCVYIALIVGVVWITLRYAMVDFLIADRGLGGMEAVRESKRLMKGNTGKLFLLNLSFIGWYLLEFAVIMVCVIICIAMLGPVAVGFMSSNSDQIVDAVMMIGGMALVIFGLFAIAGIAIGVFNLWLTPYVTGAQALFYDWTQGIDSTRPAPGGGDGGWGRPVQPRQDASYTWNPTSGPSSGTGIGSAPRGGGEVPGGSQPGAPKSPKDDPWE